MKCVDEHTREDLAKSSTILQCILAILDFECNKSHCQPEVVGVENDEALVCVDPLNFDQMIRVCEAVNKQFQRVDGKYTCQIENEVDGFILCHATPLKDYIQLS